MPFSLRAYVHWQDQTVFAGEEIECVITFKNIARTAHQRERAVTHAKQRSPLETLQEKKASIAGSTTGRQAPLPRLPSSNSVGNIAQRSGHRQTLSLGVEPGTPPSSQHTTPVRPKAHGRSLSILSIGAPNGSPTLRSNGNNRRHGKSASVQVLTRGNSHGSLNLAAFGAPTSPDLRKGSADETAHGGSSDERHKSLPLTGLLSPSQPNSANRPPSSASPGFKFPDFDVQDDGEAEVDKISREAERGPARSRKHSQVLSPLSPGTPDQQILQVTLSGQPQNHHDPLDGPRHSSDIYTHSNVSDETVNSELPPTPAKGTSQRPSLLRQMSRRRSARQADQPEHLMMGYVQTKGSFTVDGSLVNQTPFEEIKRKGVVSSQAGGGVVGVERSNRNSGLLGAFGWGSIGESINGLLGMDDMSSMREMNNVASTKEVPLLSTPQSILFVNLHLAPGESRSYTYRFEIPRGLPPTHKGRAIKVSYHLRIAVQRTASAESRNVTEVEVPFRVLGSVNRDGDVLGHDLMSPYILLKDTAKTSTLPSIQEPAQYFIEGGSTKSRSSNPSSIDSFLRYTQRLLAEQEVGQPLLSPTTPTQNRRFSNDLFQAKTMKDRIDLAVLRSNQNPSSNGDTTGSSTNRFTIARSGQHVGVLTIARPSYRLGETVHIKLDFRPPAPDTAPEDLQHTYTINASIETLEIVDPSLALRGPASIARATRKVHATETQTTLYARQAGIALEIPAQATPTFDTSGVQLQWRLRLEFTTSVHTDKSHHEHDDDEHEQSEGEDPQTHLQTSDGASEIATKHGQAASSHDSDGLLEPLSQDERGQVLVARERLPADSWEISVPLRVYGQVSGTTAGLVSDVLEI